MATTNSSGLYYPLTKMNFLVSVDEVNGVAAFNEVTGIDASVDVIEFRQGNSSSLAPVKIQGLVKHGNITLKMGYTKDQDFKTWIQNCVSEHRGETPRRNVTIELIDISDGAPQAIQETVTGTLTWILKDAWVCKYNGPDLNASTSEVAIETVEIAYEELTIPN
ncbi:phage tail protein [Pseudoflavonifractor phocaeensis]|uniref:phage tail protein n=1 Tax=Pseudoflavonifractor phocaeensis TaxID=1870988 RepID=UPI00195B8175|nr:phage tail protein [Pseudoflavonifractor phocaeensis]MBM6924803.1 phage tail protein [Pseudoflavonifractor phocaeensis]